MASFKRGDLVVALTPCHDVTSEKTRKVRITDPVEDSYEKWLDQEWEGPVQMAAFMSLLRAHKVLVDRVHAVLAEWGLSITEHSCLVYLAMSDGEGQTLGRVAERLMIGAGRCNYMIGKLERAGHVRRIPHPSDGRSTLAVLTPKGSRTVRTAIRELGFVGYGWDDMSLEQLHEVRGLLGVVLGDGCGADQGSSPN